MYDDQIPQVIHGNPLDQQLFHQAEPMEIYEQISKRHPKKISKKDKDLQKIILQEIESYCHKVLQNYVKSNDLLIDNVAEVQQQIKKVL